MKKLKNVLFTLAMVLSPFVAMGIFSGGRSGGG